MQLASVLGLKAELRREVFQPLAPLLTARLDARRASRPRHRSSGRAGGAARAALGVVRGRGRGDFRLGARVQGRGPAARALAAEIEERSRGEADVRLVPRITARGAYPPAWFRKLQRPLEPGLSIGHVDVTCGTLGFVVEDDRSHYVLSNNHVLANVNAGAPGDPVTQPGSSDRRPSARTLVGDLERFVPISFQRSNDVDAAVAELVDDVEFWYGWNEALPGRVAGTHRVTIDDLERPVVKVGRTTGITAGRITQVDIDDLQVDFGEPGRPMVAEFRDSFEVESVDPRAFSLPGDSGSLIVATNRKAVGLLYCGGPDENGVDLTYANAIDTVLRKLAVRLCC